LDLIAPVLIVALSLAMILLSRSYVEQTPAAQVRRDSTATVVAAGEGMRRRLLVNGISMTYLTPVTKMMSALPLTFLPRAAKNALVICFGMGTTHRSMLSWGIDSTAVELVPSVPALFSYFHPDARELVTSPRSHIIVDDGRRYLERTPEQYDIIVVDPPPPIGAAGSSLLYSREFYATALKRLSPDGILQQWYPGGDPATTAAVARALKESFPYVRAFGSVDGWGIHYLASRNPIPELPASELASRMPPDAESDLVEWGPFSTAEQQFAAVLGKELPIDGLIGLNPYVPAIQDDRPINEYYLLRAHGWMP
jgi:spermidine synthase